MVLLNAHRVLVVLHAFGLTGNQQALMFGGRGAQGQTNKAFTTDRLA